MQVYLTTPDQVKLHSYLIKYEQDYQRAPTVLFLHSNAGSKCDRIT
jgi:hypothetical protein